MRMLDFPIIDLHIHQWDPYNTPHAAARLVSVLGKHPFLMDKVVRLIKPKALLDTIGLTEYSLQPYLPADYVRDCGHHRVHSVVHVEANWHDHHRLGEVGETTWISQLPFAEQGVKLGAIVGTADPRVKWFHKVLAAHQSASPLFRGIRKMGSFHQDSGIHRWCDQSGLYADKNFLKGFEKLAKTSLSFDAWVYSTQLSDVSMLAMQFPDTPIVLDHLATPVGLFGPVGHKTGQTERARQSIFDAWKNDIAQLAEQKNVYTKISGLMMPVLGHSYHKNKQLASVEDMVNLLSPLVDHAMAVFGAERVMYASNFPMDKVSAHLTDLMSAYIMMIEPYGAAAVQAVFQGNAKKFYRI